MSASLDATTVIVPDEEHNAKPENIKSENVSIVMPKVKKSERGGEQ